MKNYEINENNNTGRNNTANNNTKTVTAIEAKPYVFPTAAEHRKIIADQEQAEYDKMMGEFRREREEAEESRLRYQRNAQRIETQQAQQTEERRQFIEEDDRLTEYKAKKEASKKFVGIVIDSDDNTPLTPNEKTYFEREYTQGKSVSNLHQGRYIQYLNERLDEDPEDDDLKSFGAMIGSFESSYHEGATKAELLIKGYSEYVRNRYIQTHYIPRGMTIVTDPSKRISVTGTHPSPWKIITKEVSFPPDLRIMVLYRDGKRHIYIGSSTNEVRAHHLIQRYRARQNDPFPEKTNYTIIYPNGRSIRLKRRGDGLSFSETRGTW